MDGWMDGWIDWLIDWWVSAIKNEKKKVEMFIRLVEDLPTCNRLLLSWMIVHMTHIIELVSVHFPACLVLSCLVFSCLCLCVLFSE